MTKLRTIAATAIAAGTFGGAIGALATAAVESQAAADTAAAVQRVKDSKAEQLLQQVDTDVRRVDTDVRAVPQGVVNADVNRGGLLSLGYLLEKIQKNVYGTCQSVKPSGSFYCQP
jgi:hypothetical protein